MAPVADVVGQLIEEADHSEEMKALFCIADKVRQDARTISNEDAERDRRHGVDDKAIHDAVLAAAVFCIYNRYAGELDTPTHDNQAAYNEHGKNLATNRCTAAVAD